MARTPIWKSIAATLEGDLARGRYRTGDKLPTEAALAMRFGVNRHTVRRAIADLSERGVLRTRRGSGVFVQAEAMDYPIGKRVRFHQHFESTGQLPQKRILRLETLPCSAAEADALALRRGAPVVVCEGVSYTAGTPFAHFSARFPVERLPGIARSLAEVPSVTEALRRAGVRDYVRAQSRVSTERADSALAVQLHLKEGDPILKSVGINATPDGDPVELGTTRFAGDRVTLVFGSP